MAAELGEVLLDRRHFGQPALDVDAEQFLDIRGFDVQSGGVKISDLWNPPDRGFIGMDRVVAALKDTFQHPAVLPITGPEEFATLILAEPVDVENLRQFRSAGSRPDLEPVREIIAH